MSEKEELKKIWDKLNYMEPEIRKFAVTPEDPAMTIALIDLKDVVETLKSKPEEMEIVLTGRNAKQEIIDIILNIPPIIVYNFGFSSINIFLSNFPAYSIASFNSSKLCAFFIPTEDPELDGFTNIGKSIFWHINFDISSKLPSSSLKLSFIYVYLFFCFLT